MVKVSPYCVGWSVISNVTFGLTNFLISYTNVGGIDPWAVIGWIWFTSGLIGVLTGIYFWFKIGRVFFTAEYLEHALGKIQSRPNSDPEVGQPEYVYLCDGEKIYPQPHLEEISLRAKLLTLVGGMCVGLSQLMMKWAFATDPAASGPLTAVISSDILVIGVYCHFVYNEKLTWSQAVAILVVLGGLVVMGASFDSGVGGSALGFLYAILGMLSFAASIVCIRSSCIDGIDAWSGFIGRMGVMFFMGLIALADSGFNGGLVVHDHALWKDMYIWPIVSGASQAVGVLALNRALIYPSTAVVNVIAASNSIVVLLLNWILLGLVPGTPKIIGMFLVIVGVSLMTMWKPKEEVEVEEKVTEALDSPLKMSLASNGGAKRSSPYVRGE